MASFHKSFSYRFGVPAAVEGGFSQWSRRWGWTQPSGRGLRPWGETVSRSPSPFKGWTVLGGAPSITRCSMPDRGGWKQCRDPQLEFSPGREAAAIWVIVRQGFPKGSPQGDWAGACAAHGGGRRGAGGLCGSRRRFPGVCCPPQAQAHTARGFARLLPGLCWERAEEPGDKSLVSKRALGGRRREAPFSQALAVPAAPRTTVRPHPPDRRTCLYQILHSPQAFTDSGK